MSALPERREPIDIEEFERRLRAPEPSPRADDPLAELARLVGSQQGQGGDPFAALFADPQAQRAPDRAPPVSAPTNEPLDFPDLRPLLRGGDFGLEPPVPLSVVPPAVEAAAPEHIHASSEYESWADAQELAPDAPAPEFPKQRSRKPLYIAAAVIAAGFVGVGATLAWRGGAHQAGGVATIAASTSPTKIAPKEADRGDQAAKDSTMLDRAPAPAVKKVVTREEQPMDVSSAAKTPRIIPLSDDAGQGGSTSTSGPAAVAPPPPPPLREPSQARSAFPEPKRVKTVSVRADGSIIGTQEPPASAAPPPRPVERPAAQPPLNATPKTAARATATTPAPKPVAAKPKPAPKPQVAAVQPRETPRNDEPADATDAAEAAPEARSASASGGYVVQVASAGSEGEARQAASRLGEKFSGALGGRRPSVVKASPTLYRVRVTGLSKESATAMCGRVKAAGGACFVAR